MWTAQQSFLSNCMCSLSTGIAYTWVGRAPTVSSAIAIPSAPVLT